MPATILDGKATAAVGRAEADLVAGPARAAERAAALHVLSA